MKTAIALRALLQDRRGVAATEFAVILPILILLLFGTVEMGNLLLLDKKITAGAQTAADLIAQQKAVTAGDVDNVFLAVDSILRPYPANVTAYTVASLVADGDGTVTIDWQVRRGGEDIDEFDIPDGLLTENNSLIVAVISYGYTPIFGDLIASDFTITDFAYLRPRTTLFIDYNS